MKSAVADYRYRVICLRIVATDGTTVRLTHYPRNLVMSNDEEYLTGSGFDFTGYSAEASLSPAMVDLEGIAGFAGIDKDTLASGLFDNARAYLFATTWNNPVEDEEEIVASILGKTTLIDDRYRIEEMSLIDALNQSVGQTYTASCPKRFGGQEFAGCKVDLSSYTETGTLTSVTSRTVFRDSSRAEAADYWNYGTIEFTTGDNAGLGVKEIKDFAADGTITLHEGFHYLPEVGDDYEIIAGCAKTKHACKAYSNIENFGGFSFIPVPSTYGEVGGR